MNSKEVTIFSADPGTVNFATSLIKGKLVNGRLRIKILGVGMLSSTCYDVKKARDELDVFAKEIIHKCGGKRKNVDLVYMERFQSRGNGGSTIEGINMMLGRVTSIFRHLDNGCLNFITAATWKNRANKHVDLKSSYRAYGLTSTAKAYTGKTPHELDSVLIGIYGLCRHFDVPDFEILENEGAFDGLIDALQKAPGFPEFENCNG